MLARGQIIGIVAVVGCIALVRLGLGILQSYSGLWLVAVAFGGSLIVWFGAKQLYTAAIHGYVLTEMPERRVYRDNEPRLFRNNVIAWIALFPVLASGAIIMLLDALKAQHLIN